MNGIINPHGGIQTIFHNALCAATTMFETMKSRYRVWKLNRAVRRRKVATKERKRLESKYEDRQMNLPETLYELVRLVTMQLKLKVKP